MFIKEKLRKEGLTPPLQSPALSDATKDKELGSLLNVGAKSSATVSSITSDKQALDQRATEARTRHAEHIEPVKSETSIASKLGSIDANAF